MRNTLKVRQGDWKRQETIKAGEDQKSKAKGKEENLPTQMLSFIILGSHKSGRSLIFAGYVNVGAGVHQHLQQLVMSFLRAEKHGRYPAAVGRARVDDLFQDIPLQRFLQQGLEDGFAAGLRGEEDRGESVLVGGVDVDGSDFEENLDDAMEAVVSGEMKSRPTAEICLGNERVITG